MSSAYWAADSIAQGMDAARQRAAATHELRKAERWHRGDLVLANAALAALAALAPGHPLSNLAVQNRIVELGEKTRTFAEARALQIDPAAVLAQLVTDHEQARAQVLIQIESTPVKTGRRGFLWHRLVFVFAGTDWPTRGQAEQHKLRTANLARTAGIDDSLDLASLAKRAVAE